jgi:hypothetical protein
MTAAPPTSPEGPADLWTVGVSYPVPGMFGIVAGADETLDRLAE